MAIVLKVLVASSALAATAVLAQDVAEGTLMADDLCSAGEDCGLSLRQLRLERGRQIRAALAVETVEEAEREARHQTASSAVALAERQLALLENIPHVYALEHCYGGSEHFSLMYTCKDDVFQQLAYRNGDCSGSSVVTFGGPSPWHFIKTIWTCRQGAEVCSTAWKVENQTLCAKAEREAQPGENVSLAGVTSSRQQAASSAVALAERQLALMENVNHMYALEHCYPAGERFSIMYTCKYDVFQQLAYGNADCSGSSVATLGGPSPWQFLYATWTCRQGAEVCAAAWKVENQTLCIEAEREALPGDKVSIEDLVRRGRPGENVSLAGVSSSAKSAAALAERQLALLESVNHMYALEHCYPSSKRFSVMYTCKDDVFQQLSYYNGDCSGSSVFTLGGPSPWHFLNMATWTCRQGADVCSTAWKVENQTLCVEAEREAVSLAGVTSSSHSAAKSAAALAERQLALLENVNHMYALEHCYPSGGRFSVMYTCKDDVFQQLAYPNGECSGSSVATLGGPSPWHFLIATWTCRHGAEVCASAWNVENQTSCVEAEREALPGENVSLAGVSSSAKSAAALAERQLALLESVNHMYALEHCYPAGDRFSDRFSVMYTCKDDVFQQLAYGNADCSGSSVVTLGGPSPWHFLTATWTCRQGAEVCASAWKVENQTSCVEAEREALPGDNVSFAGFVASRHERLEAVSQDQEVAALNLIAKEQLELSVHGSSDRGCCQHVYALEHCYPVGKQKFSLMYTCVDGVFTQTAYGNQDCSSSAAVKLGGKSPWHFAIATWTCSEAELCSSAWKVSNATSCVVAEREALPGENISFVAREADWQDTMDDSAA